MGFDLQDEELYEKKKLYRTLTLGLVLGTFLMALLVAIRTGINYQQIWLIVINFMGVMGVILEKRIYRLLDFELDSISNFKIFILLSAFSTLSFLRVITDQTGVSGFRSYRYLTRTLEGLLILSVIIMLIKPMFMSMLLNYLLLSVIYLFSSWILIKHLKKMPHLLEFTLAYILVFSQRLFPIWPQEEFFLIISGSRMRITVR